jgi:hypothetical protein
MHTPQPDFDDQTPIEHLAAGGDPALVVGFIADVAARQRNPTQRPHQLERPTMDPTLTDTQQSIGKLARP